MTTARPIIRLKLVSTSVMHTGGGNYGVTAVTVTGQKAHLSHSFHSKAAAEAMAAKVLARGSLDPQHWSLVGVTPGSAAELALKAEAASYELARRSAEAQRRLAA